MLQKTMIARSLKGVVSTASLAAVLAGLLLRLFFVFRFAYVAGDSLVYGDIAHNLLVHHVYGFTTTVNGVVVATRPTLIRLPGYPLFLAACFRVFGLDHFGPVLYLQVLADLGSCVLLATTARSIFGWQAGMAALWLAALCPFMANYVAAPLTETLTLFCMAATFFCLNRWKLRMVEKNDGWFNRWLLLLSLALAYAILLRPEQGLFAAAVLPAMFFMGYGDGRAGLLQAMRPVCVTALLVGLPLVPWTVRNWETFHVFSPLAPRFATDPGEANPDGFQRWYRTWGVDFVSTENVYWPYDGTALQVADLPSRAFDSEEQYAATKALLDAYNEDAAATPVIDQRFAVLAAERIHGHALRYYVALPFARLANMAFRPRTEMLPIPLAWWRARAHPGMTLLALCFALLNLAYFGLAGLTVARSDPWRKNRTLIWCMLATILMRSALLLTLDNSEPRYTLELFPVLIILGSNVLAGWTKTTYK